MDRPSVAPQPRRNKLLMARWNTFMCAGTCPCLGVLYGGQSRLIHWQGCWMCQTIGQFTWTWRSAQNALHLLSYDETVQAMAEPVSLAACIVMHMVPVPVLVTVGGSFQISRGAQQGPFSCVESQSPRSVAPEAGLAMLAKCYFCV